MVESTTKEPLQTVLRFSQIITVPQTALHTGGSGSIDELMGLTKGGEVMIFNKTTRSWLPFTGG